MTNISKALLLFIKSQIIIKSTTDRFESGPSNPPQKSCAMPEVLLFIQVSIIYYPCHAYMRYHDMDHDTRYYYADRDGLPCVEICGCAIAVILLCTQKNDCLIFLAIWQGHFLSYQSSLPDNYFYYENNIDHWRIIRPWL